MVLYYSGDSQENLIDETAGGLDNKTAYIGLADEVFRSSVLGYFTPGQEHKSSKIVDKHGNQAVIYQENDDGLFQVKMRMPDGSEEYWQQTNVMLDSDTGFKAAAFERRNEDGSIYYGSGRISVTRIEFPGNTFTSQDLDTASNMLAGNDMEKNMMLADNFTDDVVKGMQERAEINNHDIGAITVGTHSLGALAMGAGYKLRHDYGLEDTQTILLEPWGAGQAFQQVVARQAGNNFGTSPTDEQIAETAEAMEKNLVSIRSSENNMFSAMEVGKGVNGNQMVGQTYTFEAVDGANNHLLSTIANSLHKNGEGALVRTEDKDISVKELIDNSEELGWKPNLYSIFAKAASGITGFIGMKANDVNISEDPEKAGTGGFIGMDDLPEQQPVSNIDGQVEIGIASAKPAAPDFSM